MEFDRPILMKDKLDVIWDKAPKQKTSPNKAGGSGEEDQEDDEDIASLILDQD